MASEKRNMSSNEHKEPVLQVRERERERGCIIAGRKGIQEANKAGSRRAQRGSPGREAQCRVSC